MSDGEGGFSLWTVVKVALMTAGLIYIVSLVSWFAQWATVLLAIGGVGYLGYRVARTLGSETKESPKLLAAESTYDQRMRQLESEERLLDRKLGL